MMPLSNQKSDPWASHRKSSAETFWATYSDLMAGLLMIFALTTVITLIDIGERLIVPTQEVEEWERIVKEVYTAQKLRNIENVVVDEKTGALVIRDKSLQFKFDQCELYPEKNVLQQQLNNLLLQPVTIGF